MTRPDFGRIRWRLLAANLAALRAGFNYGETTEDFAHRYEVGPGPIARAYRLGGFQNLSRMKPVNVIQERLNHASVLGRIGQHVLEERLYAQGAEDFEDALVHEGREHGVRPAEHHHVDIFRTFGFSLIDSFQSG